MPAPVAALRASRGYNQYDDAAGNRIGEVTVRAGAAVQNAAAAYDALGRMTSWSEAGNLASNPGAAAIAPAAITYKYDLAGNIRNSLATFRPLDAQGNAADPATLELFGGFGAANGNTYFQDNFALRFALGPDYRSFQSGSSTPGQMWRAVQYLSSPQSVRDYASAHASTLSGMGRRGLYAITSGSLLASAVQLGGSFPRRSVITSLASARSAPGDIAAAMQAAARPRLPGHTASAIPVPSFGSSAASLGLDLIPVIGSGKALGQMVTGRDAVTRETVSRWDQAAGIFLGVLPAGRAIGKADEIGEIGRRVTTLIQRVDNPNPLTGAGYGVNNPPVRIPGEWSNSDIYNALYGRSPKGLGRPHLHHADQMPGSAIHEVLAKDHLGNLALHPNRWNQGVTGQMRTQDTRLHWWYRAQEQGAHILYPNRIYD